jgi:hypothetical protein
VAQDETRNVEEAPQDAGREEVVLPRLRTVQEEPPQQPPQQRQEEQPLELQPEAEQRELGQPEGLVGQVEQRTAVSPPDARVEVSASRGLVSPQGPTPAVINLMFDDSPSNKGKQEANIEMVDASDWPGTSAMPDDVLAEASDGWPDFAELALVRAEEQLPRWGRSTLEFRDAANLDVEPFFALDDKDEVQH